MANILDFGGVRVLTSNAQPGAGYVAEFYQSGTTTPVIVYTDSTLGTAHGTSVTADSAGRFAAVWSSGGAVKCIIKDADGATVQTIDPVLSVSGSGSDAEDITFTPTIELPFTNVQDAIEGSVAAAASGYGAFGLGVTGNAAILANIDATGTASGVYRFDGTATGTFPTGVVAATTGLVRLDRQTAAEAVMTLRAAGSARVFRRVLSASAWGSWREVATTPATFGTAGQLVRVNAGATALEYGTQWDEYRRDSALIGANGTSDQDILGVAFSAVAGNTYEYEISYRAEKTVGATSHNFNTGFALGGSVTGAARTIIASTTVTARPVKHDISLNPTNIIDAAIATAGVELTLFERGTFYCSGSGTIRPVYQLSSAPGGAYTIQPGAHMKIRRIGGNGVVSVGAWA